MRDPAALLGLLALHLVVAAPGAALLYALGLVSLRPWSLVAAAGPAFLTGMVLLGVLLIAGLVVGIPLAAGTTVLLAAAVTGALLLAARRRPAVPGARPRPGPTAETVVAAGVLALVALLFAFGAAMSAGLPVFWDDANIWSLKGVTLYHHHELIDGVFRNDALSWVHLDYPLLQPLLEAGFFTAAGGVDLRLWHAELWVVGGAAVWTVAWLLAGLDTGRLWAAVIGVVSVSPLVAQVMSLGDADVTMAGLLACGTLAGGIWVDRGTRSHALLAGLMLGGAANVKNEGLAFSVAVGVALVLVLLAGRVRGRLRDGALMLGVFAACILPWLLWVRGNEAAQRPVRPPWEALRDPATWDRLDLLWRGVEQVALQQAGGGWGPLVPAFLLLAIVALAVGARRRVVAFYLVAWLLSALSIAYMYWVTPIADLPAFEQRSGPRITIGVAFVAAVGLAHLLQIAAAVALRDRQDPRAAEADTTPAAAPV